MESLPLISVIVPVYKVEAYLDKCISSIAGQTYDHLEIILVDDGSTDSCPGICDAWAARDSRIRVIHKENGGLSDARNAGMAAATGELMAFVDSDDWIEPEFISTLYNALTETGAEICECATVYVGENGEHLRVRSTPGPQVLDHMEALRRLVQEDGVYQTVWNKLYRRSVIGGILFEKGKCNEDDFWTYRVFDRLKKLALTEKPLYNYLQRGSSIMGGGYRIKRLDGLEARFGRMQDLQKYPQLALLVRQSFLFDCMYHYQCVLRYLHGPQQSEALATIQKRIADTPAVPGAFIERAKDRFWLTLFQSAPGATAVLRNWLRVGI